MQLQKVFPFHLWHVLYRVSASQAKRDDMLFMTIKDCVCALCTLAARAVVLVARGRESLLLLSLSVSHFLFCEAVYAVTLPSQTAAACQIIAAKFVSNPPLSFPP